MAPRPSLLSSLHQTRLCKRCSYSTTPTSSISASSSPPTSPFSPRHLLSTADLSATDITTLIRNAHSHKLAIKTGSTPHSLQNSLAGTTTALLFNKRSTRTRVSTESAIARLGGHAMFLGKDDIQLGVNESVQDSAIIISSMTAAIVARVKAHREVMDLAKHSSVPVINALSDDFHPLQTVADFLTLFECVEGVKGTPKNDRGAIARGGVPGLGLEGLKLAWVGDANNVLFDLAIVAGKMGVHLAVATPDGYGVPPEMRELIRSAGADASVQQGDLIETRVPEEAVKDADVILTDTWVSMGQEADSKKRINAFRGFQVTSELAKRGGAKPGWKFMHCLPRHQEEVSDEVFYNPARSLVWTEAENRLWAMIAVLEAFVVKKGKIE